MATIPAILSSCRPHARAQIVRALPEPQVRQLNYAFPEWALDGQEPPPATASGADWRTWVIMAGRGFGKTRAGAEWVLGLARVGSQDSSAVHPHATLPLKGEGYIGARGGKPPLALTAEGPSAVRIALVAATVEEARAVMVEGPSGILASARPGDIVDWSPARRTIVFGSGAQAFLYSGASPQGLRGPEHDFAWCDELAKWRHGQATWDNLSFGLRRGDWPRALVTTTPKAGTVLNAILDLPDTVRTGGSTRANVYLPEAYVAGIEARYAGTRLGVQELDGVLLSDVEGSLWPEALLARCRRGAHPQPLPQGREGSRFVRVVVGVDPPASAAGTCGIVVCGLDAAGYGFVLEDASVGGVSPEGWARAVVAAAERWDADRVVVEGNQGGNMVEAVLRGVSATLPIRIVHARVGKSARAEPVAALFESGRAFLAGRFAALEVQLGGLVAGGGYAGPGVSPDRADAMVWALTALMLGPVRAVPRVSVP